MKMGAGGVPSAPSGLSREGVLPRVSAPPPSTPGYIPAAASRLKALALVSRAAVISREPSRPTPAPLRPLTAPGRPGLRSSLPTPRRNTRRKLSGRRPLLTRGDVPPRTATSCSRDAPRHRGGSRGTSGTRTIVDNTVILGETVPECTEGFLCVQISQQVSGVAPTRVAGRKTRISWPSSFSNRSRNQEQGANTRALGTLV